MTVRATLKRLRSSTWAGMLADQALACALERRRMSAPAAGGCVHAPQRRRPLSLSPRGPRTEADSAGRRWQRIDADPARRLRPRTSNATPVAVSPGRGRRSALGLEGRPRGLGPRAGEEAPLELTPESSVPAVLLLATPKLPGAGGPRVSSKNATRCDMDDGCRRRGQNDTPMAGQVLPVDAGDLVRPWRDRLAEQTSLSFAIVAPSMSQLL